MAGTAHRFSIPFAITVLGISHIITQITLIREFINVTAGNEAVLGILFSLWLLLTGLGSWLGRFLRSTSRELFLFRLSLLIAAFLPICHIVLIRLLRNYCFIRGELPGMAPLIVWAAVLLAPYCILTGGILTVACGIFPTGSTGRKSIGQVYFFDNIGDILGGIFFTFILVHYSTNLTVLYFPAFLCLLAYLMIDSRPGRALFRISAGILGIGSLALMIVMPLEKITIQWLYPGQKIVDHLESPYGRVIVTADHDQVSFFENGGHLFSTPNTFASEELVHFALPQRTTIRSVLLVSGGVAGAIDEIMKYRIHRLDYVELDPAIITAGEHYLKRTFPPAVHLHREDGRTFIRSTSRRYDAVLLDLPDPTSLQLNRFYTVEFFEQIKSILVPGGLTAFGVTGAEHYISYDQSRLLSTLNNTLKQVFHNVLIIPGARNMFVASDKPLSSDIAALIASGNISTSYVNENYLTDRVTAERLSFIEKALRDDVPANHDFRPIAYFYSMRIWLAMFQENYTIPLLVTFFFFIVYFLRIGFIGKVIFSTGFTASSMEVIILLSYQIIHGSVYSGIGLIIAAFMIGLAMGSYGTNQLAMVKKTTILKIESAIIMYLVLFTLILFVAPASFSRVVFTAFAIGIGTLTGAEFPVAGRLEFSSVRKTAGSLWAADLLGGSLGAFVTSLFLISFFGVYYTCLVLVTLKLLIVTGLLVSMRKQV